MESIAASTARKRRTRRSCCATANIRAVDKRRFDCTRSAWRSDVGKIDDAADKVKDATDRTAEATKDAAKQAGNKMKDAGDRLQDAGQKVKDKA